MEEQIDQIDDESQSKNLVARNQDLPRHMPDPFYAQEFDDGILPYTLIELRMLRVLESIKSKPLWFEKVFNPEIVAKWLSEVNESQVNESQINNTEKYITSDQMQYIIDELQYYAKLPDRGFISPVDGVFQSDDLISEDLRQELAKGVNILEAIDPSAYDWHPGSNKQMLDLVHPSMYPFVVGLSCECEPGKDWKETIGTRKISQRTFKARDEYDEFDNRSLKYQWLPSEVEVDKDGKCKLKSYINNLHPVKHAELYQTLETILSRFIPMFNITLTRFVNDETIGRRHDVGTNEEDLYVLPVQMENETQEDFDERHDEWYDLNPYEREMKDISAIGKFIPPTYQKLVDLKGNDLKIRKLQVIFKLADIILTPENPTYNGGVWHVEGMKNEDIVASGIYYWHNENITESKLMFRTNTREPSYEQNDDRGVKYVYGFKNGESLIQNLGSVTCIQGRAVCWGNNLQHQVQNFELIDKTKPGYRKILVIFLVNPRNEIISTDIIPPQNYKWLEDLMKQEKPIPGMPHDLQAHILKQTDWHFTHEKAIQVRDDLMQERKYFTSVVTEQRFERPFSLCEH